jgi:hypothetical protein
MPYFEGKPAKAKIVTEKPEHRNNIIFLKEFLKKAVKNYGGMGWK